MMKHPFLHTAAQSVLLAMVLGCLVYLFKDVDAQAVMELLASIGPMALAVVAVYGIGCVIDTAAWKLLLTPGSSIPFSLLFRIHLAGEAMYRFIPSGVVVGEGIKAALLRKHSSILLPEIVSSLFLRKVFMGLAQALYVGIAVGLGVLFTTPEQAGHFAVIGFAIAAVLFLLFIGLSLLIAGGSMCQNFFWILRAIPHRRFRSYIDEQHHHFIAIDRQLTEYLRHHRLNALIAVLLFLAGWFTELAETVLIIYLLGSTVSLFQTMLFEPVVSLLRSVAFMLPAGLGVMDAGYVSSFTAFGVDAAVTVSASFIIVKRMKEIVWIIIGVSFAAVLGAEFRSFFRRSETTTVSGETI